MKIENLDEFKKQVNRYLLAKTGSDKFLDSDIVCCIGANCIDYAKNETCIFFTRDFGCIGMTKFENAFYNKRQVAILEKWVENNPEVT